jgi:hypothetical protein
MPRRADSFIFYADAALASAFLFIPAGLRLLARVVFLFRALLAGIRLWALSRFRRLQPVH